MADTVRVKFLETRVTKEAEPVTYEAGQEYDLRPDAAQAFFRRGIAEPAPVAGKSRKKSDEAA